MSDVEKAVEKIKISLSSLYCFIFKS